MRGPRLFDHADWKNKKRSSRPQMFCFPLKVSVKSKKRSSLFVISPPHFLRSSRFQPAWPMPTIHIKSVHM